MSYFPQAIFFNLGKPSNALIFDKVISLHNPTLLNYVTYGIIGYK
jgi:hypothetical protein